MSFSATVTGALAAPWRSTTTSCALASPSFGKAWLTVEPVVVSVAPSL